MVTDAELESLLGLNFDIQGNMSHIDTTTVFHFLTSKSICVKGYGSGEE